MRRANSIAPVEDEQRLSMTVAETTRLTGFSRDKIYDLLRQGDIRGFLVGGRRYVDAASLRAFIRRVQTAPTTVLRSPQPKRRGTTKWAGPC